MRTEFHPEATLELSEAMLWYEARVPGLGGQFAARVEEAVEYIERNPEGPKRITPFLRRWSLKRFRYGVIYSVEPGLIFVYAVAAERREPNYWSGRVAR